MRGGIVLRVAVIGANGFVGSRLVEQWHLEERADVVPVVRRPEAAAAVLRFGLDWRVADALDERELTRALAGCDAVVHAGAGPRPFVTQSPACVVRAAAQAGAQTVVYLSSMAVHGWQARPGTDEATPLPRRHPVPYNRWKVRGERALRSACRDTGTRFVILRPGIVYGPRSQWIAGFARSVVEGSAYVVAGGRGVCNAIYVDNLVYAVGLTVEREEAAGETFLVADADAVTWRMLYEPVCRALGRSWDAVADLAPRSPRPTPGERLLALKEDPAARAALDRVPRALRNRIRRLAARPFAEEPSQDVPRRPALETSILQTCRYRFPTTKARRLLDFEPPIAFDEACHRTVAWLGFAGYPVAGATGRAA
jgi:nucleoside-diphosphate-sugar epimerase